MTRSERPVLEVRELTRRFGGLAAVDGFSFSVWPGTVHGLIGPNGAGKTTTFNLISGFCPPTSGRITYSGQDVSGWKTSALAAAGLVRTFQGTTLFQQFTVLDNVRIGCHGIARAGFAARVLGRDKEVERRASRKAWEILEFFGLERLAGELACNLPHGHQRTLGLAIAVAADPRLLLLDEPFTGMNPEETQQVMSLVRELRAERDITIMLVEHDMQAVMGLCDVITVMNFGRFLTEGKPEEIRAHPAVIEAYLGTGAHAA
jgi:branched-chain amino acid transport system ATP-binding protein